MIVWKLDALMRARGVKGRELARRLDIGENYLSRIRHEVPERLSLELLDGLCRELGCEIADLLEHRGVRSKPRKQAAPRRPAKVKAAAETQAAEAFIFEAPSVEADGTSSAFIEDVLAPLMAELAPALDEVVPSEVSASPPAAPEPQAETAGPVTGSAVLKTSLLQSRLDRLKRRRPG